MYNCFWASHYCADLINMIPSNLVCLMIFFMRFVKWYSQNSVISKGLAERTHVYSVHYRIGWILIVLKIWFIFTHYYNMFKLRVVKKFAFWNMYIEIQRVCWTYSAENTLKYCKIFISSKNLKHSITIKLSSLLLTDHCLYVVMMLPHCYLLLLRNAFSLRCILCTCVLCIRMPYYCQWMPLL